MVILGLQTSRSPSHLSSEQGAPMASAGWEWMAEVAGEELAKLEAAHPGRFAPLKAELQRLVADPGWDADALPLLSSHSGGAATATASPFSSQRDPAPPHPPAPAMCTQESSTQKRRQERGAGAVRGREEAKRRRMTAAAPSSGGAMDDRADMVIKRAERCLERIRAVKRSLLASWVHN
ncbi:hypothetical protein ACP4OV_010722 [Aristida adscensionis]